MNKKILILCISFICVFLNVGVINAIPCEYDDLGLVVSFDENGNSSISQTVYDESTFEFPIADWFYGKSSGKIEYVNEPKHQEQELYGSCPAKIYACTYEKWVAGDLGINIVWDQESALFYAETKNLFVL